jgi:hypothetical protein
MYKTLSRIGSTCDCLVPGSTSCSDLGNTSHRPLPMTGVGHYSVTAYLIAKRYSGYVCVSGCGLLDIAFSVDDAILLPVT